MVASRHVAVAMKVEKEKRGANSRWVVETRPIIDRAVAALIFLVVALVAHLFGLDGWVAQLLESVTGVIP
jgi:hypothetical protein